ncbi:hypothetical protein LINGRAHAP2_LOCUS22894 [Linum grandiflorum]
MRSTAPVIAWRLRSVGIGGVYFNSFHTGETTAMARGSEDQSWRCFETRFTNTSLMRELRLLPWRLKRMPC